MTKASLVLEGGATRGVFTSGALDYLMEKNVYLSHVIGVSAGSCNGVDYVSKQIGRTRDCMIHKEKEYDYYMGIRKFIKEKSLLNMDMEFEVVTTNCITGKAEYMKEKSDKERLMKICRASSSMPLVSPIVNVDGVPYLDGGLADSIPINRATKLGNKKVVLILTRNMKYRKKLMTRGEHRLYQSAYKKYPKLVESIRRRPIVYNRTMDWVESLEKRGKIFVLRPQIKPVSRLEKNYDSLMNFYEHGYHLMERQYDALMEYLEK